MSGNSKGFTLVEIMMVVVVMGILMALALPNIRKYRETSQAKSCQANLKSILDAVDAARLERDKATLDAIKEDGKVDHLVYGVEGGRKIKFLRSVPTCPTDGSQYSIEYDEEADTYSVTCGSGKEGHEIGN